MAAGLRYKFHGSEIRVLVDYDPSGTSAIAINAITQANPPVVTTGAAHGLEDGGVVRFSDDVGGMLDLRGIVAVVNVLSPTSFELPDFDSTNYTAFTSGGTVDIGVFSNFCELTNYSRAGGSAPEIPATSLCSTGVEVELGLRDYGTTTLDYNFAPNTTIQRALEESQRVSAMTAVQIVLPSGGGTMTQMGFVQSTSEQAGVGTPLWTGSATIRNTGSRYDVETA